MEQFLIFSNLESPVGSFVRYHDPGRDLLDGLCSRYHFQALGQVPEGQIEHSQGSLDEWANCRPNDGLYCVGYWRGLGRTEYDQVSTNEWANGFLWN